MDIENWIDWHLSTEVRMRLAWCAPIEGDELLEPERVVLFKMKSGATFTAVAVDQHPSNHMLGTLSDDVDISGASSFVIEGGAVALWSYPAPDPDGVRRIITIGTVESIHLLEDDEADQAYSRLPHEELAEAYAHMLGRSADEEADDDDDDDDDDE